MATALPAATDFTGASITEAQFKTALTNMRTYLSDLLGADGVEATALAALQAPFSAVNAQAAAYSLVAADRGKVIYYTGTGGVTLTLPVTSTTDFGIGYMCAVVNQSTGIITVARSSTDTIDGASSIALAAGESCILLISASAKWVSIGKALTLTTATVAPLSRIRQVVTAAIAGATGTTSIPLDDTSPVSTEGTQIVAASITPNATANKVLVRASFTAAVNSPDSDQIALTAAVFRGTTCIGAAVVLQTAGAETVRGTASLEFIDSPSSTGAQTYSIRVGVSGAGDSWYVSRHDVYTLNAEPAKAIMSLSEIIV